MKKQISFIILTIILILGITGCGHKSASKTLSNLKSESVSSSVSSETFILEEPEESQYYDNNSYSDETTINETTKAYPDNETPELTDLSTSDYTDYSNSSDTISYRIQNTSSSISNNTYTPQNTRKPTTATTSSSKHNTAHSIPVSQTTTGQPSSTTAISQTTDTPQTSAIHSEKNTINVTISISCKAAINNSQLNPGITLPSDGIILNSLSVKINEGDTVYDAFHKACSNAGIKYEFTGTALRKSIYISSIAGLSQMDCGQYSGWKYSVNGTEASIGCSLFTLSDGDIVDWHFTTTL